MSGLFAALCWLAAAAAPAAAEPTPEPVVEGLLVQKASGAPVMGAPVEVDSGARTTLSDETGRFRLRDLPPGRHRLRIDDPECAPFEVEFDYPGGRLELRYALDPRGQQDEEEVVIRTSRLQPEVSDTVLEIEEVKKIPGTQGDVLKIVQSLPGVARNLAMGNGGAGVVVRGAAPEDSKVLIDGHPVPLLYHFGGLKSVLNSDMLKRIDFLPGGFGAEFGQAIGGIIDVQTLPCTHRQFDGYAEMGLLDAGFFLKGPLGEDAGFFAAARRSTVDLWLPYVLPETVGLEMTVAPVYYDYQAKVDWSPNASDRLSLLAFGSSDRLEFLMQKPVSADPSLRGDFGMEIQFHRLYLGWIHAGAGNWQLSTSLAGGWDYVAADMGQQMFLRLEVPHGTLRSDLNWRPAREWSLQVGLKAGLTYFETSYVMPRIPKEGEIPNKFQTLPLVEGVEDQLEFIGALYAAATWQAREGTALTGGVRLEGYAGGWDDWALMPRFSLHHELRPGTAFKAGVGLYLQPPTEDELSENFGNPNLAMERAWHFTLGIQQQLPLQAALDVTYFYKSLDRLVVSDETTHYSNGGVGKVSGLEVMLRRELTDELFGWLAYTFMRSMRRDAPGEDWRLFDFDQTHILTLVAGYRLPSGPRQPAHGQQQGWEFGLRFQLVSGNPVTPILGGIYDADYDTYLPIPGPTNSQRLPLYHRLDLRVDYTWAWPAWALSLFLDLQNVYNYRSIEGIDYNLDYTQQAYFQGLPILPALGVKGSF